MKIKRERERERNTLTIFFTINSKCQVVYGCYWWVKK